MAPWGYSHGTEEGYSPLEAVLGEGCWGVPTEDQPSEVGTPPFDKSRNPLLDRPSVVCVLLNCGLYSHVLRHLVKSEARERWMELCTLAIHECDPDKFAAICRELWQLLEAKQQRIGSGSQPFKTCWMCCKPVSLETCKIDEQGRAVHGECYAKIISTL
jgi:hypothetical protein